MTPICQITLSEPPIDRREILRYAGAKASDERLEGLLSDCLDEVLPTLSYRAVFATVPITHKNGEWDLGFAKIRSGTCDKFLSDCSRAILVASTVGLGIDRLILRTASLSPLKALLIEAIGSERIEALCDAFEQMQKKQMNVALATRFSPGYGDLPLSLQEGLLSYLNAQKRIGIALGESLLMTPRKSVTAIIGIKNA